MKWNVELQVLPPCMTASSAAEEQMFSFQILFFQILYEVCSLRTRTTSTKKTDIVWTFCISRFFNVAASDLHALLGAPISPPDRLGKDRCHEIFILPSSILYNFGSYRGPKVAYNLIFTCMQHLRHDKIVLSWNNPPVYMTVPLGLLFSDQQEHSWSSLLLCNITLSHL
jgi:hypothetical protein